MGYFIKPLYETASSHPHAIKLVSTDASDDYVGGKYYLTWYQSLTTKFIIVNPPVADTSTTSSYYVYTTDGVVERVIVDVAGEGQMTTRGIELYQPPVTAYFEQYSNIMYTSYDVNRGAMPRQGRHALRRGHQQPGILPEFHPHCAVDDAGRVRPDLRGGLGRPLHHHQDLQGGPHRHHLHQHGPRGPLPHRARQEHPVRRHLHHHQLGLRHHGVRQGRRLRRPPRQHQGRRRRPLQILPRHHEQLRVRLRVLQPRQLRGRRVRVYKGYTKDD